MQIKTHSAPTQERVTPVPLGDFDVWEDETALVNRLYYAVPSFEGAPSSLRKTPFAKKRTGI